MEWENCYEKESDVKHHQHKDNSYLLINNKKNKNFMFY